MTDVIIGIDPHKGSHTAVALDRAEKKLGQLRLRAAPGQVDQLRRWASAWPDRMWAVEGARGLVICWPNSLWPAGNGSLTCNPNWRRGYGCSTPAR